MLSFKSRVLLVLALSGAFALNVPAFAQKVDEKAATADPALPTEPNSAQANEQPLEASPNLRSGTKAEAEHSAEATARKSVSDPNNQRGTSLQGRTRPIAGDVAFQNGTALATTSPEPRASVTQGK